MMEILVVLAVFSTVSVAVADLFMLASRAERRTGDNERVQSEARFVTEFLAREIRSGSVAYDLFPSPFPVPATSLSMRRPDGTVDTISVSPDPVRCGRATAPCLVFGTTVGGAPVESPLTPAGLTVEDFKVYVTPGLDPNLFDPSIGTYASDESPLVTFVLSLVPVGHPEQRIAAETAVTPRVYAR